jgi:hypothetical protein
MSHLSPLHHVAAGLRALPEVSQPFAATQAAWRFYANAQVSLPRLAAPLIEAARDGVSHGCDSHTLIVLDWSNLHYGKHAAKADRVELSGRHDLGYELLTALAVSDRDGSPLAPVCLELRAQDGLHTTRQGTLGQPLSPLDGLEPVMAHVDALGLGRRPVYIIDREADSVGLYRQCAAEGRLLLVRADDTRLVIHDGRENQLIDVAKNMSKGDRLGFTGQVLVKGQKARQYVGQSMVILHRPARTHRMVGKGKKRRAVHVNIPGPPITLRLVVSEIRAQNGKLLARWLLLSNAPAEVSGATLAVWYYWRWQIESYHKLLKGAGLQIEHWLQDDAAALSKRLAVAAMAAVVVWRLARDQRPQAHEMRTTLVRLSGRQIKRGKNRPNFTEPALLAGLGALLPMLYLLELYSPAQLRRLAQATLPSYLLPQSYADHDDTG